MHMGDFPSGQRGQTVNLLAMPSVVRIHHPPPEKDDCESNRLFQLNPPFRVGEIIFDDEIPFGDEIRLDAGWVDLISSAQQISSLRKQGFHYIMHLR